MDDILTPKGINERFSFTLLQIFFQFFKKINLVLQCFNQ